MAVQTRRDVFQAIADPTRRDILNLLTYRELNLNAIADRFDMSRPAISQHIKILNESGLIVIDQKGRERFCYLQPQKMKELSEWLAPFQKLWEQRFNRFDNLLDKMKSNENE